MKEHLLLLAAIGLLSATATAALDPSKSVDQYVHTSWTTVDGLPQNTIRAIVRTGDGYLWLATIGGLVRFDGIRFTAFEVTTHPGLGSNGLTALFEDRRGTLWIGSRDGHVVTLRDGVFELRAERPNRVLDFHEESDGTVVATLSEAELRWRQDAVQPEVLPRRESGDGRQSPLSLTDRKGNFWRVQGTEIQRFLPGAPVIPDVPEAARFRIDDVILSLLEDDEGNLWIGTSGGLHRLHDGAFTSYLGVHGFTDQGARAIVEDADGVIYLATRQGIFRFAAGRFTRLSREVPFAALAAAVDRAGRVWFGRDGLARLEDGRLVIARPAGSLPGSISALYAGSGGGLWIGFVKAGLARLRNGELTVYGEEDGLVGDTVGFITEDRRNEDVLWIGTYRGLSRFAGGRFTNYTAADGLPAAPVRAIYQDAADILWIGTYGGGLARFEGGRVTRTYSTLDGLPENTISRILADEHGNFWFSGNRGITRVRRDTLELYTRRDADTLGATLYGSEEGMTASETVGGFQPAGLKASDGRLWFPTLRGAVVVDPAQLRPAVTPPLHIEGVFVDDESRSFDGGVVTQPGNARLSVRYTALQFALPREVRFRYCLVNLDEDWIEVGDRREAYYPRVPPGSYTFEVQVAAYAGGEWSAPSSFAIRVRPYFWQIWELQIALGVVCVAALVLLLMRRNRALQEDLAARQRLADEREELLREMDTNRVLAARLEALERLAAEDEDGHLARLAGGLARQERLYAELLRAESPAHLAALRDKIAQLAADAQKAPDLEGDFLGELHRVLDRLGALERLPTGEDRAQVLGEALRRALAMREERERSDVDSDTPGLGSRALDSVQRVFSTALRELHQRAELRLRLRSRQVNVRHEAVVVLEVENAGQGTAHDLRIRLTTEASALFVRRAEQQLKTLRRGQSARLEFLVEPRHSERVRLVFHVTYDDPERRGKELEFADLMELRQIPKPDTFRPLLPNPYVVGRPLLLPDPFYGRAELFERLASSLQGAEQDNVVVLIGQRRMGKTSILRRLDRHLPASYVPVLVDLQGLLTSGEPAFFAELTAQIADELEERGVKVNEPTKEDFRDDPGQLFRRRFLSGVRESLNGRRLLLVFDEMEVLEERIMAGELTPNILPYLRSLMQHEENVSFMLAGTHRLDELTADYWGVLFNLAVYLDVGHLSEDDVVGLFKEPTAGSLEIDPLALDKVYRTTGGHPHFSQLVARELVELCNRQKISYVTIQDVNRVIDVVADKGQLHITYLWDEADNGERLLLLAVKELLEHEGMASFEAARRRIDGRTAGNHDLAKALRRLLRKEILGDEAGQLHFRIDLLRRWLDRHQDLEAFARSSGLEET